MKYLGAGCDDFTQRSDWRLGASVMIDQNLVLSNENGASNWVEDHTNVKPLQNHVNIHHFIFGNKLDLMISKPRLQWNIIPSLKIVYSKPRKPQNEIYSTQGCSWMVLKLSTEVASKYMVNIKGFDLNHMTTWWIGLKLIEPKLAGEIWCGLKTFTEVLRYVWNLISRWSMCFLHLGYSPEAS